MKTKYVALLSFFVLAPALTLAQAGASQETINQLLQQIKALQTQIQQLQAQQTTLEQNRRDTVTQLISALKEGSRGNNVKTLQAILAIDQDIYPESVISGYFGKLTANAVKRFQKKYGIEQAGHIGPKTLKKLNELLEKHPLSLEVTTSTKKGNVGEKHVCAIIPPGHLIASGWLRKHDGERPIVPECQKLPRGIERKLENDDDNDDDEDNHGGGATTTPPTDISAPIISNVVISNLASTTAKISWTTNELAIGKLYFGTSTPLNLNLANMISETTTMYNHQLNLLNLSASTTYYYVVEAKDTTNNIATTSQQSLVTLQ
ncbi:MAG: peptidoglycan-binding protein [Patescibacteria group bacterium]